MISTTFRFHSRVAVFHASVTINTNAFSYDIVFHFLPVKRASQIYQILPVVSKPISLSTHSISHRLLEELVLVINLLYTFYSGLFCGMLEE
jgi:hypothetical protein